MATITDIPGNHVFRIPLWAAMAAAGTDDETVGFTPPAKCTIQSVKWVPKAAVTADGTNYSILSLRNRKADASGAVLPATRSYVATNSVALVPEAMTLSGTATDLNLAAGDVLTVQRLHTGTGVVIPAGIVEVTVQYTGV